MCDRDTAEVPVPVLDLDLSISENYCFHFLPLFTWHKRCKTVEMENCKRKKKVQKKKIPKTSESSVMKGPEIFSVQSVLVHSANDCHGDLPDVEWHWSCCCNGAEQQDPQQIYHWPLWGHVTLPLCKYIPLFKGWLKMLSKVHIFNTLKCSR